MPSPFIGRRKAVGFGVEATRGTKVAPTFWFKHLSVDFYKKTKTIQNESAMNRMEKGKRQRFSTGMGRGQA
jgi:hypothetical protein